MHAIIFALSLAILGAQSSPSVEKKLLQTTSEDESDSQAQVNDINLITGLVGSAAALGYALGFTGGCLGSLFLALTISLNGSYALPILVSSTIGLSSTCSSVAGLLSLANYLNFKKALVVAGINGFATFVIGSLAFIAVRTLSSGNGSSFQDLGALILASGAALVLGTITAPIISLWLFASFYE